MLFKNRLLLALFLGLLFHLGSIFYISQHKIQLMPMQRQGMLEWSLNENLTEIKPMEEIDREEVIHAFFSSIAPQVNHVESLVSNPEEIPLSAEAMDIEQETYTNDLIKDSKLTLAPEELSSFKTSSEGLLSAKELIDHLEIEGIAYGSEEGTLVDSAQAPTANLHQGIALLESKFWESPEKEDWEKELIASLETQNSNFTQLYRGTETLANSETFQAQVEYLPRPQHGDYLFRISLTPKKGRNFKRIKQNIFFLLDRSSSINKTIYYSTRDALSKSLSLLHPEDSFNVLVFDDQINSFSQEPSTASKENIQKAQEFLKTLNHGGIFSATDIYRSLNKIIPQKVSPQEANVALLLSDGDTFLSLEKQRKTIEDWTTNNEGKVSLFSFAIGTKNNLPLLDVISSFNRGILIHSPSINTIPFILKNFIQSIRYPLGKIFKATTIPSEPYMKIKLYPKNKRLPLFYENIPYVLYGSTTHLEDFSLFLQGKHYTSWLDIQIPISFSDATPADASIEKQMAIQQAYDYYEKFLTTGSIYPLMQAKELLGPFEIETAFGTD